MGEMVRGELQPDVIDGDGAVHPVRLKQQGREATVFVSTRARSPALWLSKRALTASVMDADRTFRRRSSGCSR